MILKRIFLIAFYFLTISLSFSNISLKILMKINNEIITSYDIEQEKLSISVKSKPKTNE